MYVFFFKQKTAYEVRISDWSSDVCSSDLAPLRQEEVAANAARHAGIIDLLRGIGQTETDEGARRDDPAARRFIRIQGVAITQFGGQERTVLDIIERERSEERRVGKGCVSKCRSRWSPFH